MDLLDLATTALGIYSTVEGISSQRSMEASAERSVGVSESQAQFTQQMYDRVIDIYGTAEENLAEYYNSLTPEEYTARGLDAYDDQFQQAINTVQQTMAQRGIAGSGIEAQTMAGMEMQGALDRATIKQVSPQQWAIDQMGFVNMGMGAGNVAAQSVANSSTTLANIFQGQSNMFANQASSYGQAVGDIISAQRYSSAYNQPVVTQYPSIFN
jgi:hypothetical protein